MSMILLGAAFAVMLYFAALTVVRPSLYDRVESPVWVLEDRLSSGFASLTGGSRQTLRKLLLAVGVLGTAAALVLADQMEMQERLAVIFSVIGGMLFISFRLERNPPLIVRGVTLGCLIACVLGIPGFAVLFGGYEAAACFFFALARLTDFIMWADHRKPRQRRESEPLPERFLQKIREAGLAPASDKA